MFGIESILSNLNFLAVSPELMFGIGGFLLNVLVLPTLVDSKAAVPRTQSVLTALVLLVCFAIPYYSIGYHIPAIANAFGFLMWTLVALYRAPATQTTTATEPTETSHTQKNLQPAD